MRLCANLLLLRGGGSDDEGKEKGGYIGDYIGDYYEGY